MTTPPLDPFAPGVHQLEQFVRPVIIHLDGDDIGLIQADRFALGDNLMVTGLIRNLGRKGLRVYSPYPELFEGMPQVERVVSENIPLPDEDRYDIRRDMTRREVVYPTDIEQVTIKIDNAAELALSSMVFNFIAAMSVHYGAPETNDRTYLTITPGEASLADDVMSREKPNLVIAPYKESDQALEYDLDEDFWAPLIEVFAKFYAVHQLGSDRAVPGVDNFLPEKLPLRTLMAVMSRADAFLGLDGGLAHVARAFESRKRIITIYPHFTAFSAWGYKDAHSVVLNADVSGYEANFHPWDPRFKEGQTVSPRRPPEAEREDMHAHIYGFIDKCFGVPPDQGQTLMMTAWLDDKSISS